MYKQKTDLPNAFKWVAFIDTYKLKHTDEAL